MARTLCLRSAFDYPEPSAILLEKTASPMARAKRVDGGTGNSKQMPPVQHPAANHIRRDRCEFFAVEVNTGQVAVEYGATSLIVGRRGLSES